MAESQILVGDDVEGSPLPGAIHPVATRTFDGKAYQAMHYVYPEVPGALTREIVYTDGNPTLMTYKDGAGTTLATRTLTWTDGKMTLDTWSFV